MRCRIVEKNKMVVPNKSKKMRLVGHGKKVFFFCSLFSVFLFPIFFFISYSLFSFFRREKKKKTKRVEEKKEGFPPGPPVSLYKK